MSKHIPIGAILTALCIASILFLFVVQARIVLEPGKAPVFSLEKMNIAYGYSCGNGLTEPGEACDDGNASNTDACLNTCVAASCGDTYIRTGVETCEDGNSINTDACLNTCISASCGDGYVYSVNEDCDPPGSGTCGSNCHEAKSIGTSFSGEEEEEKIVKRRGPPPNCGNGVIEESKNEICDDGRFNGLSPTCDRWCGVPVCGDGIVLADEEECEPIQDGEGNYIVPSCGGKSCSAPHCTQDGTCSDGCRWFFPPACPKVSTNPNNIAPNPATVPAASSASSASSVYPQQMYKTPVVKEYFASSASSASAVLQDSLPQAMQPQEQESARAFCGNGVSEGDEQCDQGSMNSNETPDGCRTDCRQFSCGDGTRDSNEQCDDGNDILGDGCTPLCTRATCGNGILEFGEECDEGKANSDTAPNACSVQCLLPRCGDSIIDTEFGEICDNGDQNSNTAKDACRLSCIPAKCGDGTVDTPEQCDDGNVIDGDHCSALCMVEPPTFWEWLWSIIVWPFTKH